MEQGWGSHDPHVELLCCPVCGEGFSVSGRTLRCALGHAFDVARSGYVNLVPGGRQPAGAGDTSAMLAARRRFLERGWFAPLSALVNRLVGEGLRSHAGAGGLPSPGRADGTPLCVVEVGTGTGHHLAALKASLTSLVSARPADPATSSEAPRGSDDQARCWFGLDVSKAACRLASTANPAMRFVVADVKGGLPLRSSRALAVLDVFAPRNAAEFRRIVHPEGLALVVIPGPDHLGELVRRLGLVHVHPGKEEALLAGFVREGFRVAHREELRFGMDLGPEEIADLVAMGPSARHLPPHGFPERAGDAEAARAAGTPEERVTASFVALLLRPEPHAGRAGPQPGA